MKLVAKASLVAALTALVPSAAFAHTGTGFHSHGLMAGLAHPVMGWDHLIGLLAVGFWSMTLVKSQQTKVITTFFAMLVLGFVAGASGIASSVVESGIAASVLLAGLLLIRNRQFAMPAAAFFAAFFAVFHGIAHGAEASAGASFEFAVGFMLTSAMLFACGSLFQLVFAQRFAAVRYVAGAGVACAGLGMMAF